MKKGLYFVTFIAGAAIGSVTTWYCVKKKYEQIAQEEIDSVKEVFAQREFRSKVKDMTEAGRGAIDGINDGVRRAAEQAKDKPDVREYAAILKNTSYASGINQKEEEKTVKDGYNPYVISPEEFGEFEEYEKISLTYYADGILADDNDEIVDDAEDIVGDALDHFGEYEDDSVFVRCDERRCDYEILLDQRTFAEVTDNGPGQVEV